MPETEPKTCSSVPAFYEWLIRVTSLIRARKEAQPRELFDIFVRELGQIIQFDALAKYDAASNAIEWYSAPELQELEKSIGELSVEQRLGFWVYSHQETVVLGTLDQETRFPTTMRILRRTGVQSVYAFPLTDAHRRLGSLVIASVRRDAYSPEEVQFCSLAATQIALAMDDAINFRASQQARERLELLLDLTNRVVSKLNLHDVLREISANIRRVMGCDGVAITLPRPEDQKLRAYVLDFPGNPSHIEEGYEPVDEAGAARVFRSAEAAILSRQELELVPLPEIRSVAHVPLKGQSGIVGVLTLGSLREGAFAADDLPFLTQIGRQVAIAIENAVAFGEVSDLKNQFAQKNLYLEHEIRSELYFEEIVFKSEAMSRIVQQVETVAPTDSTVLVYGETGTGKELIARAVCNRGARRANPLVRVNCAAIPTGLLESELFGHERGAFTGAVSQRVGRFELANHGTIFLDEIGELPLELQPKLLRVLQDHEFERLGSSRTLRTDARLIAATNRDLEAMVKEQKFRSDLYYRLNVFPIHIPPLRARPEDIPLLVRHYVQEFSRRLGRTIDAIPSEAMTVLVKYPWPGNVRELQNVLERAVILTTGTVLAISSEDLRIPDNAPVNPAVRQPSPSRDMHAVLEDAERRQILSALEETNWIVAGPHGAAARLGLKRSTLLSRMQKLGIHITRRAA